ncbi:hypothetical protein D3C81_1277960 [compost metagenome]
MSDEANYASWESNITIVFDRPISNADYFLNRISQNFTRNIDPVIGPVYRKEYKYDASSRLRSIIQYDINNYLAREYVFSYDLNGNLKKAAFSNSAIVIQDSTIDNKTVFGAETYTPHINDEHNTVFFPLNGKGGSDIAYNLRQSTNEYNLSVPSFSDVSGNSFGGVSTTLVTGESDVAAWVRIAPTATLSGSTVTVKWSANDNVNLTPVPAGYNVYYSNTRFGSNDNWSKLNSSIVSATSYTAVLPQGTHFFRVVPINSLVFGTESGFSLPSNGIQVP